MNDLAGPRYNEIGTVHTPPACSVRPVRVRQPGIRRSNRDACMSAEEVHFVMAAENHLHPQNRILSLLPRDEAKRLAPHLEQVDLEFKQVLCEAGESMAHVYFPTSGV